MRDARAIKGIRAELQVLVERLLTRESNGHDGLGLPVDTRFYARGPKTYGSIVLVENVERGKVQCWSASAWKRRLRMGLRRECRSKQSGTDCFEGEFHGLAGLCAA